MSKNDPNYTKSNTATVYLHEILFMPISRSSPKVSGFVQNPRCFQGVTVPLTHDAFMAGHAAYAGAAHDPRHPANHQLPAEDPPPAPCQVSSDSSTRRSLHGERLCHAKVEGPEAAVRLDAVRTSRDRTERLPRLCSPGAQLCVMNLLDVITAQQKQTGAVRVSNYHVHMFGRLLHEHETSSPAARARHVCRRQRRAAGRRLRHGRVPPVLARLRPGRRPVLAFAPHRGPGRRCRPGPVAPAAQPPARVPGVILYLCPERPKPFCFEFGIK